MLRQGPGLLALVGLSALLPAAVLHRFGSTQRPLRKDAGSAFDGRCVWALQRVLGAEVPAPAGVTA